MAVYVGHDGVHDDHLAKRLFRAVGGGKPKHVGRGERGAKKRCADTKPTPSEVKSGHLLASLPLNMTVS